MTEKNIQRDEITRDEITDEEFPQGEFLAEEERTQDTEPIMNDEKTESNEDEPEDEISALKGALDECESKVAEYLDGWQRARAEFTNYRKRMDREREQVYKTAAGSIIKRYLSVLDDLELALKNRPQNDEGSAWAEGVELIYRKLKSTLEVDGVKPMKTDGEFFDPNLHEAIAQTESDEHESGQIIEAIQQGYYIGERVLRPAVVRIAA